jgi:hypothetical protein
MRAQVAFAGLLAAAAVVSPVTGASAGRQSSKGESVTLFAQPRVAGWTEPVDLFGAVSSRKGGEIVRIQAKDCGSTFFAAEAQVRTRDGGGWSAQFSSGVNSVVRAVWEGATSAPVSIGQRQSVVLEKERSGSGFRVGIAAKRSFWHKRVRLERRLAGQWKPVRWVVLTDSRSTSGAFSWTEARFTVDLPKGEFLRAVLPLSEARPCYLGGTSRTVRT